MRGGTDFSSNLYQIKEVAATKLENAINQGRNKNYIVDPGNLAKYSLVSPVYNNENNTEGFAPARPTTALMKVIDKFSAISGFGNSQPNSNELTTALGSGTIKDKKQNHISAYQLQHKVGKIAKIESKLMSLQADLTNDLIDWASDIPNSDSEKMVKKFSSLISIQKESNAMIIEKLDKLKLNLAFVNEREKKQNDLISMKAKILKQLRDSEVKYGPNSSATTLLRERLEENICNLGVVEIQYIRSISKNLKESLIDYLYALQAVSSNLSDATNDYFEVLLAMEANAEMGRNSPRKVGNQSLLMPGFANSRKDYNSEVFGGIHKTSNDVEYEPLKNDIGSEIQSGSVEGAGYNSATSKVYTLCNDCLKNNKTNDLNNFCTHRENDLAANNATKINLRPEPSKITSDIQGYEIKDAYPPAEQWG